MILYYILSICYFLSLLGDNYSVVKSFKPCNYHDPLTRYPFNSISLETALNTTYQRVVIHDFSLLEKPE